MFFCNRWVGVFYALCAIFAYSAPVGAESKPVPSVSVKKASPPVKKQAETRKKTVKSQVSRHSSAKVTESKTRRDNRSSGKLRTADRKSQTRQDGIEKMRSSLREAEADRAKIRKELQTSEAEIKKVRKNLSEIRRQRGAAEKDLAVRKRRVMVLENELTLEQKVLEEINRQRLELQARRHTPHWASSDPNQAIRVEMMLSLLASKSSESIKRLERSQKELKTALAQSERANVKLTATLNKERQEQQRLNKERRDRQKAAAALDKELLVKSSSLKKLEQDEKRLKKLMGTIKSQEIKTRDKGIISAVGISKNQLDRGKTSSTLISPVEGKIAASYGQKRSADGKLGVWKGTVYSVDGTKDVHAVRDGKVVFSDYLRGYGNLLIIDHGRGYFSVYGNNSELDKDIGDPVKTGEVVSRVGKGEGTLSILYFEMRHNGKPIAPTGWINL